MQYFRYNHTQCTVLHTVTVHAVFFVNKKMPVHVSNTSAEDTCLNLIFITV